MNKNKYQPKFKVGKNQSLLYLMENNRSMAYMVAKNLPKVWNDQLMECFTKYQDIALLDIILKKYKQHDCYHKISCEILTSILLNKKNINLTTKTLNYNHQFIHSVLKKITISLSIEEKQQILKYVLTMLSVILLNNKDKDIHLNKTILLFNLLAKYEVVPSKIEILDHLETISSHFKSLEEWEFIFNLYEPVNINYVKPDKLNKQLLCAVLHWLYHNENKIIEYSKKYLNSFDYYNNYNEIIFFNKDSLFLLKEGAYRSDWIYCETKTDFVESIIGKIKHVENINQQLLSIETQEQFKYLLESELYQQIKKKFFHEHLEKELVINSIEKRLSKI